ncbi:tyrosine-type recombinase/integrase [Labilibaculum antarcticum]|uniref:Integrase n=1 Tax=Labilibaculum antarcticum TaxID=1717717 RepID=A0A1Y1CQ08_9BACT|nr:site-specific integrase [Labilibaculum antarcticum]BAX82344.1 integrase [Labilibaculum antarcticum]
MTCTKVTLRKKAITKGRHSLYLDYYPAIRNPGTMKMTRREVLGIYIFQVPKNSIEAEYNKEILQKAEGIRAIRVQSLINEEFNFLDKHKQKANFLDFFYDIVLEKDQKWLMVYTHFSNFVNGKCKFEDVTIDLCRKFRAYLLNVKKLNHTEFKISKNSAASYFSTFRALLKIAYRDKFIPENINDFLEKIDNEDTKKEYLTLEELKKLANTPCKIPVLKSASIFACLTGLRISDVLKLDWSEIVLASDDGYCMRIRTEKTETETTLPISEEALELCGTPGLGRVFKGLDRYMVYIPLKKWVADAGITKNITFHCFRHTFATLQIAAGTDIYTVSKMLTHKNVSTTQIYADLVSFKKRESANRISLK